MDSFSKTLGALALFMVVMTSVILGITMLSQEEVAKQSATKSERIDPYYRIYAYEGPEALTLRIQNGITEADCQVEELDTTQFTRAVKDHHTQIITAESGSRPEFKKRTEIQLEASRFHSTFKQAIKSGCRKKFGLRAKLE